MNSTNKKQYIGDSVYIDFDGFHFILTTDNGFSASNTIYLEDWVIDGINTYVKATRGN